MSDFDTLYHYVRKGFEFHVEHGEYNADKIEVTVYWDGGQFCGGRHLVCSGSSLEESILSCEKWGTE